MLWKNLAVKLIIVIVLSVILISLFAIKNGVNNNENIQKELVKISYYNEDSKLSDNLIKEKYGSYIYFSLEGNIEQIESIGYTVFSYSKDDGNRKDCVAYDIAINKENEYYITFKNSYDEIKIYASNGMYINAYPNTLNSNAIALTTNVELKSYDIKNSYKQVVFYNMYYDMYRPSNYTFNEYVNVLQGKDEKFDNTINNIYGVELEIKLKPKNI